MHCGKDDSNKKKIQEQKDTSSDDSDGLDQEVLKEFSNFFYSDNTNENTNILPACSIASLNKILPSSQSQEDQNYTEIPELFSQPDSSVRQVYSDVDFIPETEANNLELVQGLIKLVSNEIVLKHVQDEIILISVDHNVARIAVSRFLKVIRLFCSGLPSDYRALLKTPRNIVLRTVLPGKYVHISIKKHLNALVLNFPSLPEVLLIDVFCDGVAFFDTTSLKSFWVILGRFSYDNKIFPIGIYNGSNQPENLNNFLEDFIDECIQLKTEGVEIREKRRYGYVRNFLADSLGRAGIAYIKHPTGYKLCLYCHVQGVHINNRVVFLESDSKRRTCDEFRSRSEIKHHTGESHLSTRPEIDIPTQFPLDYLHCVLLGATKKILTTLFNKKGLLSARHCSFISGFLTTINEYVPSEIHRVCPSLNEIGTYKGCELRVVLLKIGQTVFKNTYRHVRTFHATLWCDHNFM